MTFPVFDPATAYLVAGFLYVVMPLAGWVVMGKSRTLAAGVWCAGSVGLGIASLLLSFRTSDMPGWIAFGVMNAFFYGGNLTHVVGLRMELGLRSMWRSALLVGVTVLGVQEFFRVGLESPVLRLGWVLLAMGSLFAWTAWLAWQIHKKEGSLSARWLTQVYALGAAATLLRAVRVLLEMSTTDPLVANWDSVLTTFSLFVMSVFGSVAILGLYLERSTRRDVEQAIALEKQEASNAFALRVAHLDRQRSMGELAAAMAHELSQPLTVVSMECGLLKRELKDANASQRALLDKIQFYVERASRIVKGIRNFMQPAAPDFEPVNLVEVVQDVRHLMASVLREQQVTIEVHSELNAPGVLGDFVQLSQVVLNVLRNAMEAQAPGVPLHVLIHVRIQGQRLLMTMEDNGPGFSDVALANAGVAFSSTKEDGMGIGIAISRRIAQQHGGTLVLSNRVDGSGARVLLDLPMRPSA